MEHVELTPNRRMTMTYNQDGSVVEVRLEYKTQSCPEWKPAKGGFNVPVAAVSDVINKLVALHDLAHGDNPPGAITAPSGIKLKKKKKKVEDAAPKTGKIKPSKKAVAEAEPKPLAPKKKKKADAESSKKVPKAKKDK